MTKNTQKWHTFPLFYIFNIIWHYSTLFDFWKVIPLNMLQSDSGNKYQKECGIFQIIFSIEQFAQAYTASIKINPFTFQNLFLENLSTKIYTFTNHMFSKLHKILDLSILQSLILNSSSLRNFFSETFKNSYFHDSP